MTTAEPHIATLPERHYLAIPASVTMETLGTVVPPLNGEVFGWLAAREIAPGGPPFWKYNVIDMARGLEVEAGCPVAEATPGDGRVIAGVLPAGRYATVRHVGHPQTLVTATAALLDWAAAQGLAWDTSPSPEGERWGARLEIYYSDPATEPDMTKWETELTFRLADPRSDERPL
jgi:effector-binding domain-containing protein